MSEHFKLIGDVAAGTVTVLTVVSVLPAIAAALTIEWTAMRIYEGTSGRKFSDTKLARFLRGDWA
jgi:hypothetical protein